MKKCKCGKEFEPCRLCRAGENHQQCVDDAMCHDCHMTDKFGSVTGYVRCRFCDTNWDTETANAIELPKDHYCAHGKFYFTCPACGFGTESYFFPDERA